MRAKDACDNRVEDDPQEIDVDRSHANAGWSQAATALRQYEEEA